MAKEFDIYLNRRPIQCDIVVYVLPSRDYISVKNTIGIRQRPISASEKKLLGGLKSELCISQNSVQTIKTDMEQVKAGIALACDHFASCQEVSFNPAESKIGIASRAKFSIKKYRLVGEMDASALSDYNDMPLDDVDHIVL